MTNPRRWPTNADNARIDAIALAARIDHLAEPLLEGEAMTKAELIQRAGQICRAAQKIISGLQAVGPNELKD